MLRLAVTTRADTYQRMQSPLAERGIEVGHLPTSQRIQPLDADVEETTRFDVGFVFPPRLPEGGVADAMHSMSWVNDREAVLRSRHKGETLARLATADLPVPETVVVSNPVEESDLVAAFQRFDPPVVVKPNATTRGVGVAKAHDLDSFLGLCDYLGLVHDYRATGDRSFLVQEFLADARDYRAMVVDGRVVGGVERHLPDLDSTAGGPNQDTQPADSNQDSPAGGPIKEQQADPSDEEGPDARRWKHNVHRGASATGVDLPDDVRDLAARAAATLEVPWLGVDVLVAGDRTVVTETNARPTIDDATKYEAGFWDDVAALVRAQRE